MTPESCKVYTPRRLADAMVCAIRKGSTQSWLEPCVGKGVFVASLRMAGVSRSNIMAVDLDRTHSPEDRHAQTRRGTEFLKWARSAEQVFDCFIGNPPFIAIRALNKQLCARAAGVLDLEGNKIGIRSNTWYAFLLTAIRLLKPKGQLAFILPAAAEFADYCQPGRTALTSMFDRIDLIRSKRPMFEPVQDGSIVLVCRGKGGTSAEFRRHEALGLDEVIQALRELKRMRARSCPKRVTFDGAQYVRLGDVMRLGLGGVTGDASFYAMSESRRVKLGLPVRAMRRVVTRSSQVRRSSINDVQWRSMLQQQERVWLFRPTDAMSEHPSVQEYLSLPSSAGGCKRGAYKVRNREPWHRIPLPPKPDAFISGMCTQGVWLCFNECMDLNATSTLYVVHFTERMKRSERYSWALAMLCSSAARELRRCTRVYAAGLRKIEPGQLANLRLRRPAINRNAVSLYRDALGHLLAGRTRECRRIADTATRVS